MNRRFLFFSISLIAFALIMYYCHIYLMHSSDVSLSFRLDQIYYFNVIASLLICLAVEVLSKKLPAQVGFAYLASMFVKIGLFVLLFNELIFKDTFPQVERLSIVLPMMIFLIAEAGYAGRLMNKL